MIDQDRSEHTAIMKDTTMAEFNKDKRKSEIERGRETTIMSELVQ